MPKPMRDLTGQRFERLVVTSQAPDRFDKKGTRQRYWNCLCDCGERKVVHGSALSYNKVRSCGCLLRDTNAMKKVATPTYISLHQRLRRTHGHASTHSCVDCSGQAHEWSYDGQDPDEVEDPRTPGKRYSVKDEHYHPRCRPCHRRMDRARGAQREERLVGF